MDKLVLAFGRPYKRVGKSTVRMSKDEYERLILEKHKEKLRFDNQICEEASYDDIDEKKVEEFLKQRAIKLKVEIPRVSIKVGANVPKKLTGRGKYRDKQKRKCIFFKNYYTKPQGY